MRRNVFHHRAAKELGAPSSRESVLSPLELLLALGQLASGIHPQTGAKLTGFGHHLLGRTLFCQENGTELAQKYAFMNPVTQLPENADGGGREFPGFPGLPQHQTV